MLPHLPQQVMRSRRYQKSDPSRYFLDGHRPLSEYWIVISSRVIDRALFTDRYNYSVYASVPSI